MSAPASAQSSANLARQQLDELDALLQRMLELPVHPPGEGPAPHEMSDSAPVAVFEPEPEAGEASLTSAALLLEPALPAAAESSPGGNGPAPDVPSREPAGEGRPLAPWLWPLVWSNQAFDRCAIRMGRLGRWLRRRAGRAVLGWTGLALLTAAAALLVLDWIRWNR